MPTAANHENERPTTMGETYPIDVADAREGNVVWKYRTANLENFRQALCSSTLGVLVEGVHGT
jgi:hypothetical protein